MKPELILIAAVARNGVIGRDNALIWRLRDDLRRFKALTTGHAVIMGRKTWESLGRPLPQRRNIVITRHRNYGAPGAEVVHSLEEALARCAGDAQVFVIGGGQVYAEAMAQADRMYLTEVDCDPEGDAHFPAIDAAQWQEASRQAHSADEAHEHAYSFVEYRRKA